jgi:hypothetical protein
LPRIRSINPVHGFIRPRKPLSAEGGPWQRIIANAVEHPDEHLCKAVRSLSTFAARWGGRPAGYYADGGEDGLEGHEVLDESTGRSLCALRAGCSIVSAGRTSLGKVLAIGTTMVSTRSLVMEKV